MPPGRQQRTPEGEGASPFDRARQIVVVALLVAVPPIFWRPAADVFALPKAVLIWIGTSALVAITFIELAWTRRGRIILNAQVVAVGAFVLAAVIATVTSPQPALSLFGEFERYTGLLNYLCYAVIAVVVATSFRETDLRTAMRWVTVAAAVPLTYGIVQWSGHDIWTWQTFGFESVSSTFGNANFFAGYAAIMVPLATCVSLDRSSAPWLRGVAGVVALEAVVSTVVSHSIQGPVAAAAGLFVVGVFWSLTRLGRGRNRTLAVVGALGVGLIGLVVALGPLRGQISDGFGERRYFWGAAVELTTDHPIVGTGLDTFGQNFLRVRSVEHARKFGNEVAEAPHNVPLGMFSNGGILLGGTYLAVIAATAWALVLAFRRRGGGLWLVAGVAGAWIAYEVQAAVSMDVPSQALMHWFLIGAALVLLGAPRREIVVPGKAVAEAGRGRHRRRIVPAATWGWIGVTALVAAIAIGWALLVPFAADVDAGSGFRTAANGGIEEGLKRIDDATSRAPWRSRYWLLLSDVYDNTRQYERALPAAEQAARREPGSSEYAVFAARLANQIHRTDVAATWYRRALSRDPVNTDVFTEALDWAEKNDGPWRTFAAEHLARLDPEDPQAWRLIARDRQARGHVAGARAAFRRVLEILPKDPEATRAVARERG